MLPLTNLNLKQASLFFGKNKFSEMFPEKIHWSGFSVELEQYDFTLLQHVEKEWLAHQRLRLVKVLISKNVNSNKFMGGFSLLNKFTKAPLNGTFISVDFCRLYACYGLPTLAFLFLNLFLLSLSLSLAFSHSLTHSL